RWRDPSLAAPNASPPAAALAPPARPRPLNGAPAAVRPQPTAPAATQPAARAAAPGASARTSAAPAAESDEELELRKPASVLDAAPPWLVTLVVHLALLLILALFVSPFGEGIGRVMLTIGQSERQSPG